MIFSFCPVCQKRKFVVRKRAYIVPQVSPKPIMSMTPLCLECFDKIKFVTLGIPISRFGRLVRWIKSYIIKANESQGNS